MADLQSVALLGAGSTMGRGMARNLSAAGLRLRLWNRTREKIEELGGEDGIAVCGTARAAAEGADAVLTMVSDSDAVLAAMEGAHGALAGVGEGAVWLQMSTIGTEATERCAELAREQGLVFVDAPVLGTRKPAEDGQLVVLASGPEEVRGRLGPLFDAVGKRTLWLGEAGAGSRLKVVVNTWILSAVEATAEMLALAGATGVDPAQVLEAISDGPLDLPYMRTKAKAMLERNFTPSFGLGLAAKDAGLATTAAAAAGLELPMLAAVREQMAAAAGEHGDEDMAAVYLAVAPKD
jgi:3-hydroxyisobutyrate dehydrogenase